MRIDFVITELNMGGAEKALTEIALTMQRQGHQVRVLSIGSPPVGDRGVLADRLADEDLAVHFGGFDHWIRLPSAMRWLKRLLRQDPPELCQTFLFHANCLGTFAAAESNVPFRIGGVRVAESIAWRCHIERRAAAKMDRVTCVSERVRRFVIHRLNVDPQKCVTIPNGVDVTRFASAEPFDWRQLGWDPASKVALFVGRFHPQKGLELIRKQTQRLFATADHKLLLVGDGPLRSSLQDWADSVGSDQIQLIPWQREVAPLMKAAQMVLLPSHYEGMPNVMLEAMAAGRPVVCSLVEGSDELLPQKVPAQDPVTAKLDRRSLQGFPPGDSAAMAERAERFFADEVLCQRVGAANQKDVQDRFSIASMTDAYAALYQRLQTAQPDP
ncbi:glycosyltransferase [Roseiconus nitratireducens]|nr:glycosyltransferase [Roseiconus nitratireducens]